jgi:diacylglycerol kinase
MRALLTSFTHAFHGLREASSERNFRLQLGLGAVALAGGRFLGLSLVETALLVMCVVLVLGAELFNSAIERLLDVLAPEPRPEVRAIKDLLAAAVLTFSVGALLVGVSVFGRVLLGALRVGR